MRESVQDAPHIEGPDFGDDDDKSDQGRSRQREDAVDTGGNSAGEAVAAVRPFENLADLPDDLAEAFEMFKLAILRHKTTGWEEISREDVMASLDALKELALAPA